MNTLVSGGTDNHLLLVNLTRLGITGRDAEVALGRAGITVNKNAVPFDPLGPNVTSGIRIGTPAQGWPRNHRPSGETHRPRESGPR